jgi:predicted RNase H-like HicB family nuclease
MTDSNQERVAEMLTRPYSRVLIPDENGGYSAQVLEFPGCFAEGETSGEAMQNLERAAESWIIACLERGMDVPAPLQELSGSVDGYGHGEG